MSLTFQLPINLFITHPFYSTEKGKFLVKRLVVDNEWRPGYESHYPVNDEKNGELYKRYRQLADKEENIIFGGRLGEYKYYDMDVVIAAVLEKCKVIL